MSSDAKFGMLRKVLRALGLSQQSADDVVNFIVDLLAGERKTETTTPEYPYHLRDDFLSPAELNFHHVLRSALNGRATVCTKVGLRDLFYVKRDDPSRHRIYTNKIDRKHVDFLLCDPETMRPLLGIELDDKSHRRKDRQERDAFVDEVFQAAHLPLLHIPVQRTYHTESVMQQVAPFLHAAPAEQSTPAPVPMPVDTTPRCPKCGSMMKLRISKKGANAGKQFWGCSNYPKCRGVLPIEG